MFAKYETHVYEVQHDYKKISVFLHTAKIEIEPSNDGKTKLVCFEDKTQQHVFSTQEDTLVIECAKKRKWYDLIKSGFRQQKLKLFVPQSSYEMVSLKSNTGDIHLSSIRCDGDINIDMNTGKMSAYNISCKNFNANGSTGNILLKNVIASETISIKNNTGDVALNHCDGAEIFIETKTGNINGRLLSDKVFVVNTKTGKIKTPTTSIGERCEVRTNTGNITFE